MIRPPRSRSNAALLVGAALAACSIGLTATAAPVGAPAGASAPAKAQSGPAQTYSFSFQDADISAVASEILGNALGINYTVDPAITGKMSFRIDQQLTRIQLLEAFEAALAANDVALVHRGDSLALEPPSKARLSVGLRTLDSGVHPAGYQVLAVPLSYASPSEVGKVLEAIAPANTVLYASDKFGLLILSGSAQDLQSALDTVKVLDRDELQDSKMRWFVLSRASATSVASDLDKVIQASSIANVSIAPLKRLNGLLVFSRSPSALDFAARWIERLDQASQDTSANLWTYHPKNVSAEALSHTLSSLLSGGGGGMGGVDAGSATSGKAAEHLGGNGSGGGFSTASFSSSPSFSTSSSAPSASTSTAQTAAINIDMAASPESRSGGGEDTARFSVDKESNTLLISAPMAQWIGIQRVLSEIDRSPRQILIEASILEVTLTKDFHFGVDWSVLGSSKRLSVSEIGNASGTIAPSYPGFSTTFLSGTIQAAVTALGSHSDVEVISAPKIIALDNHTAKLQVGDQVPIITQSSQSTVTSSGPVIDSVDYKNTGVIMNVTPRISGEDKVVLDISQEVSTVAQTTTSGINSPTIQDRLLESTLVLQDGGVVALGGLISSNQSKTVSGIPFIQNAPVIGSLFRGDTRSLTRTELIVLLTAKILPDANSASHAITDLAADMTEIKARGLIATHH